MNHSLVLNIVGTMYFLLSIFTFDNNEVHYTSFICANICFVAVLIVEAIKKHKR